VFDCVLSGLLQDAVKQGKVNLAKLSVDGTFSPGAVGEIRRSMDTKEKVSLYIY